MILLAFSLQFVTALSLNFQATFYPQVPSGIWDIYKKDDPIGLKQMETNDYYDDFYNQTEWEESEPNFSPQLVRGLLESTDGTNNLCMNGHLVPEVFVIGGIKAGTTTLCTALMRSPAIVWPRRRAHLINWTRHPARWKEGHYFDFHKRPNEGKNYMITDFPSCNATWRAVAVDGSARYSQDPEVPGIMSSWYGDQKGKLKFVLILREPLARLHSHYYHSIRDNWCVLHKQMNFSTIINGLLLTSNNTEPQMPKRSPVPGCADFLDGSLYSKQLKNYFKYFEPKQFILVPFWHNVDPGHDGRPSEQVATFLWSKLGIQGVPGEPPHANNHHTNSIEDDLTPWQIDTIRAWFDKLTGPAVIANMVRSSGATLFGYDGNPDDAQEIAQWLGLNW